MARGARIRQVKTIVGVDGFDDHCAAIGADIPTEATVDPAGPLAQPFTFTDGSAGTFTVGNRFTALPMEGWDGTTKGTPTDLVRRRWERAGAGGPKLIWGGEAVAVDPAGRANPNQLVIGPDTADGLADLHTRLVDAHRAAHGDTSDLVVGLQLTHSGRFSRPDGTHAPRTAFTQPTLDARVGAGDDAVLDDDELDALAARYVEAAALAADAGFAFVDIKHCHGYLLHELLSARDRSGRYGGDLSRRMTFLATVTEGIRARRPDLAVGVRLSAFDFVPFAPGADGRGEPVRDDDPWRPFGADVTGTGVDLAETHAFVDALGELGIGLVCVTAGSPYTNPHIQRPAYFPPSDGYSPPNDPLVDVARQLAVTAELCREHPGVAFVGSGYSYLQDFLGNVAQAAVRAGGVTSVGLGRMMLSYPTLAADLLGGAAPDRRLVCRTFSDCTTAPRHGMISGCYPLDVFYKDRPERLELAAVKKQARARLRAAAGTTVDTTPSVDSDDPAADPGD